MTEITVRGKSGVAQLHGGEVWILFKGYTMFLEPGELDELIALLQAMQQEIALKEAEKGLSDWKGGVIFAENPETGV